jgi:hypothetical protein
MFMPLEYRGPGSFIGAIAAMATAGVFANCITVLAQPETEKGRETPGWATDAVPGAARAGIGPIAVPGSAGSNGGETALRVAGRCENWEMFGSDCTFRKGDEKDSPSHGRNSRQRQPSRERETRQGKDGRSAPGASPRLGYRPDVGGLEQPAGALVVPPHAPPKQAPSSVLRTPIFFIADRALSNRAGERASFGSERDSDGLVHYGFAEGTSPR